jgi:hypothetical protein
MKCIAAYRFVDRSFRLKAFETLAAVRSARSRFGIHRLCAREAGTASRSMPHTA